MLVVNHMSKFIKNDAGIMGLTLSQIGLIIVTGILLTAVFSIIFLNDWQRNAELKNIATSFSTIVEGMDTRFFENTTEFHFPDKTYYYNVSISTEYVVVSAEGNQNNKLSIKERFIVKPWPRTSDQTWKTGEELHKLDKDNAVACIDLALSPLYIQTNKAVYIEKVVIYYGISEKQDFLLIYQIE